jgi:hypothetical protein
MNEYLAHIAATTGGLQVRCRIQQCLIDDVGLRSQVRRFESFWGHF